jgi:hypothetical protein
MSKLVLTVICSKVQTFLSSGRWAKRKHMHIVACVELQMGNESFRMCCTDFIFTFHLAAFPTFLTLRQLLQLTILTKCPEFSACYRALVCVRV